MAETCLAMEASRIDRYTAVSHPWRAPGTEDIRDLDIARAKAQRHDIISIGSRQQRRDENQQRYIDIHRLL